MTDAPQNTVDTAAADTVLAKLTEKSEKQGEKAEKAAKKAKKIKKAMKQVLKTYGIDPKDDEIGGTPPAVIEVLADMGKVRDKFTAKSVKKATNQADYDRAATMVRKAFKIEAPKETVAPRPRREIIFAVDAAVAASIKGDLRNLLNAEVACVTGVIRHDLNGFGRQARSTFARFTEHYWQTVPAAKLLDVDRPRFVTDAIKDNGGYTMLAAEVARGDSALARHFVIISDGGISEGTRAVVEAFSVSPNVTLDFVMTGKNESPSITNLARSLRASQPHRVGLHRAEHNLGDTLSAITHARLGQRLSALKPASIKTKAPLV